MKRDEIVARVRMLAPEDGFILEADGAIPTVNKALKLLADQGIIESPRVGWWKIVQPLEQCSLAVPPTDIPAPESDETEAEAEPEPEPEPERRVHIQREIGNGPESVYVYYHDAYAELARRKGLFEWECKVGSTLGDPDLRVIGEGALTAFPRCPIIGLVIRTENARSLERAIHAALTLAGKRIEGGGGYEWFLTSPDRGRALGPAILVYPHRVPRPNPRSRFHARRLTLSLPGRPRLFLDHYASFSGRFVR
jgi:hypothetical protein